MNQSNIVQRLKESVHRPSGEWRINRNGVTWNIGLSGPQLHYAHHSLQTLERLEQFLPAIGLDGKLPAYREIVQTQPGLRITEAVAQLRDRYILNPAQIQQLLRLVAEDALECLLWADQVESQWQEQPIAPANRPAIGINLNEFIPYLEQRIQSWKRLAPTITTPHQCPRCDDFSRLQQPVPQGILPSQSLEMMARLMQGLSLRQIAFLLKQDGLKLCQMLHPYINAGVLRLEPPSHPHNQLPTIPATHEPIPSLELAHNTNTGYASPSPIPGPVKKYKVVCIDDSPTVLETIQRYLGTDRFEVATVENPMASLSALFDMKPDLILMDVSMPGIDGNRLCQILKRSSVFTHVPIVMVSGNTGVLDQEKAKAAGATDYLTKPFSREELLALVDQYLSKTPAYVQ